MTETAVEIPGYVAGTWTIDPVHSEVSFVVRHMMVSKVRGRFDKFEGTIVTAADPLQSSVNATVDLSSVNTGEPNRASSPGTHPRRPAPSRWWRAASIHRNGSVASLNASPSPALGAGRRLHVCPRSLGQVGLLHVSEHGAAPVKWLAKRPFIDNACLNH